MRFFAFFLAFIGFVFGFCEDKPLFLMTLQNTLQKMQPIIEQLYRFPSNPEEQRAYMQMVIEKDRCASVMQKILLQDFLIDTLKDNDPLLSKKLMVLYYLLQKIQDVKEKGDMTSFRAMQDTYFDFEKFFVSKPSYKKEYRYQPKEKKNTSF